MTAYNREKYIVEAIESILASTYTNFELIIVDDCSSDNTVSVAQSYEAIDSRIKVYINEKNLGQFANRNKAALYSSGTYMKYVDSDDIIYPYTLAAMVAAMQHFPDAALGFCLTHGPCKKPLPYLLEPCEVYAQHFFGGGLLFVGPSGLIIKKEVFFEVKCFEEYGMPSDNHLALKIAGKYPVVAMTRDLFWWRLHPDQAFGEQTRPQSVVNNFKYTNDLIKNYSPLSIKENKRIIHNLNKIFYKNLIRIGIKKLMPVTAISLFLQKKKLFI
ncbi:MAG: glycosyltransferase family 2 protein [Ginsengibacter sp.]